MATIKKLKPDTEYIIKVVAFTSFGSSPSSTEFKGMTLRSSETPIILWSAAEGLLKSDAVGDNLETLIHKDHIKDCYFSDIAWYRDQIYVVTNNSLVYWYNLTTHNYGKIVDNISVGSIAVDWLGKKIYWSNPQQQLIIRANLNGLQHPEALPILTIAKELIIDSAKAYFYWATVRTVECARLNGADRIKYHELKLFSTKQVMGLTLNMDHKYVYWIVRGSDGSNLYRSAMAGYSMVTNMNVEKLPNPKKVSMQGPLCYFHNHFLWLQDSEYAAISDLEGKNIATIGGKTISDLTLAYVIDPSQQLLTDQNVTLDQIDVIPDMIHENSIHIYGTSASFNISWTPVHNVNYGTVFYEVQIDTFGHNNSTVNTIIPSVKYWNEVAPFTQLYIAVRAYTYWGTSPQVIKKLFSPASTPSAPLNLRAYVTHDIIFENVYDIVVRWDKPIHPNGIIQGYKVHCWFEEDILLVDVCMDVVTSEEEYVLHNVIQIPDIYYFQVQAFTEIGDGNLSESILVNSSRKAPIPALLIASFDSIFIHDIDANKNYSIIQDTSSPIDICYLNQEKKIFWVNQKNELFMYHIPKNNKTKLFDINGNSTSITIDWIGRCIYYTEKSDIVGTNINKVNLNHLDKGILKNDKILYTPSDISEIEISPFTKKLYWTEKVDSSTYRIMQSSIESNTSVVETFFIDKNSVTEKTDIFDVIDSPCNCSLYMNAEKTFTLDHSNMDASPLIVFVNQDTHNVMSSDKDGCFCNTVMSNTVANTSLPFDRLKSDFVTLYWTNPSQKVLHALRKNKLKIIEKQVNVQDIIIYGAHIQPYPPRECLSPRQKKSIVSLKQKTSHSLLLVMPETEFVSECENFSIPPAEYHIYYREFDDFNTTCDARCFQKVSFGDEIEIENLKPFTKYIVMISISNYYSQETEVIKGPPVVLQTAAGAPSKPRNISAIVLNPNEAEVVWLPPAELNGDLVYYEIHWQTEVSLSGVRQRGEQSVVDMQYNTSQYLKALLQRLSPNEVYSVWVRVYCETNETSSESDHVEIKTYPEPDNLTLINKAAYALKLEWNICSNISDYRVQYAPITSKSWININTSLKEGDHMTLKVNVKNLKPKTLYKFRLSLFYERDLEPYVWPLDSRFIFETLGDRPSPPGVPIIQYTKPYVFKVWWEAAKDNGAPIELYMLECLQLPNYRIKRSTVQNRTAWFYTAPSIEEIEREWAQVYNGTDTSWIINGLEEKYKYAFRVSALNLYGWSNPSLESTEFDFTETARLAENQTPQIVIGIAVPLSLGLFAAICLLYQVKYGRCLKKKNVQEVVILPRGPDVELATLRELPRRGIHNVNMFYITAQPTAAEISLLPHIRRDNITLTKFLGSGAFGEVFEGRAVDIEGSGEMKVAVKTLRKGASDQEKCEFLQEAQLMSHFKHEHILQLLGVCLDNDPNFIIMELMEGGDLLTYLRASRSILSKNDVSKIHDKTANSLTLKDLVKMCVDVSKGCRYLEEMHFVHRDLACRNCLVSSNVYESRIVKIGDFGLARDIYKNDYYRKEGEGLLPVRWMAPESLVDGVFTSQSDVWAFGVLLWEIMTIGQQPYPARNNLEVLHYVRSGGRLKKPLDCPEVLYSLMLKCWEFEPNRRPTFKYCLEILEELHEHMFRTSVTGAHEGQYISTVPERVSWKSDNGNESLRERTPFLPQSEKENTNTSPEEPKYIEIVSSESEKPAYWDGYEIPNEFLNNEVPHDLLPESFKGDLNASESSVNKDNQRNMNNFPITKVCNKIPHRTIPKSANER